MWPGLKIPLLSQELEGTRDDVAEGVERLLSRSRSLESWREEAGQTESEDGGRGCEGRADGHRDFHSGFTLGSLEKSEFLSLTESCHTW